MVQRYWSYFARKVSEKNCNIFQDPFTTRSEGWIIRIVMRDGEKSKAKKREREIFTMVVVKKKTNKQKNEFLRIPKIPSPPITFLMSRNIKNWRKCMPRQGGGGYSSNAYTGRSNPLPFYTPFFTKKVPLSCTFYWQIVPLSRTMFRTLHLF